MKKMNTKIPPAPVGKQLRPVSTSMRTINAEERTIEFVASSEAVDRYGDIIKVSGWQLENYKKNPVFLWAHRSGDPPIGKCVGIEKDTENGQLVQKIQFAKADEYPFADTIFKLFRGGYMNAVSVGFRANHDDVKPRIDPDTGEFLGYTFEKQELLELSAVPVPANPEALGRDAFRIAVTKGVISETEMAEMEKRGWCGEDNPPWAYMAMGTTVPATPALRKAMGKGDRVRIKQPHMEGHETGTVEIVEPGSPFGVMIDGMEHMGVHKWYAESEMEPMNEEESTPMPKVKSGLIEREAAKEKPSVTLKHFCDEGRDLAQAVDGRLSNIERQVRDLGRNIENTLGLILGKLVKLEAKATSAKAKPDCPEGDACPYEEGMAECPKGEACPMKDKSKSKSHKNSVPEDGGASPKPATEARAIPDGHGSAPPKAETTQEEGLTFTALRERLRTKQ